MIETEGLTKTYGQHTVVDNLSFRCAPGEVVGFLGPNGAGKSTTMKMITGFVASTSGTASVCGHDIAEQPVEARKRLGYLPEGAPCYPEMTPLAFLEFIADIRQLSASVRKRRLQEVISRLHLEPVLNQDIETLSKGFKRRVGLAQAILHDPDVLILDEPTDGLDPNQKHEVRELIRSMSADKLILISTHILEEVEAVCTRAIIIAEGTVLADDAPQTLAATSRYHNAVRIVLQEDSHFDELQASLEQMSSVATIEPDRQQHSLLALAKTDTETHATWREVSELVAARQWTVSSLQLEAGRLEDVFRQITGGARA